MCVRVTVWRVGTTVLLWVICPESVVSLHVSNCACVCSLCVWGVCLRVWVCVGVVLWWGMEDEVEGRRKDRTCDCQMQSTKSQYGYSRQRPTRPASPSPESAPGLLPSLTEAWMLPRPGSPLLTPGVPGFLGEGRQEAAAEVCHQGYDGGTRGMWGCKGEAPHPVLGVRAGVPEEGLSR